MASKDRHKPPHKRLSKFAKRRQTRRRRKAREKAGNAL